jgi:spore coat protein A, manganese oxidase
LTTRRIFLRQSALAVAGATLARRAWSHAHTGAPATAGAVPNVNPDNLARFVDRLPLPLPARPVGWRPVPGRPNARAPFYRVSARRIESQLHRDLPPTAQWSYGGAVPGVMFDARSGQGLSVEWVNELPAKHFLPIDHSLHGAEPGVPEGRTVVHLHGARTTPESDGYPEDWCLPGQSRTYHYPNEQDAALLWYHDHAMGINRLNIYAGLAGLFVIRDPHELGLRLPAGKFEIPLVLCDRDLRLDGQLSYPVSADPERPWVPEVFGALQLVNGKIFPYLEVEPRRYRLRVLNAANGRFYRLSVPGGVQVHQIGSDQGLLPAPVSVGHVQLAPAERADLVVDFGPHRGARIVLSSDSFALMEFRVGEPQVGDPSELPTALRPFARIAESAAVRTRRLTLDESQNRVAESTGMLLNRTPWHAPITEKPLLDTTEIWEFVNLTDDVHPIHLHLVRFQILDRRPFDAFDFLTAGKLRYLGPALPPEPNEMGWKDTVRVNAKTVTRIIVPFAGYAGRYVWHCHILEHEDNEMMRPYEVLARPAGA